MNIEIKNITGEHISFRECEISRDDSPNIKLLDVNRNVILSFTSAFFGIGNMSQNGINAFTEKFFSSMIAYRNLSMRELALKEADQREKNRDYGYNKGFEAGMKAMRRAMRKAEKKGLKKNGKQIRGIR